MAVSSLHYYYKLGVCSLRANNPLTDRKRLSAWICGRYRFAASCSIACMMGTL